MTGADEQELRGRLDTALMTITPRPAPIDTVMRQGRHLMYRRRISAAGGLAAVAVAAVAVPCRAEPAHRRAGPGPAGRRGPSSGQVPVHRQASSPQGPSAPRTGAPAKSPRTVSLCPVPGGSAELHHPGRPCRPHRPRQWGPHHGAGAGRARRDTGYGQAGRRPTAGAAPSPRRSPAVGGLPRPGRDGGAPGAAYAGRAELSHVIPFTNPAGPSNLPTFNVWLAPGAAGHPRVTTRLGAGMVNIPAHGAAALLPRFLMALPPSAMEASARSCATASRSQC